MVHTSLEIRSSERRPFSYKDWINDTLTYIIITPAIGDETVKFESVNNNQRRDEWAKRRDEWAKQKLLAKKPCKRMGRASKWTLNSDCSSEIAHFQKWGCREYYQSLEYYQRTSYRRFIPKLIIYSVTTLPFGTREESNWTDCMKAKSEKDKKSETTWWGQKNMKTKK